MDAINPPRRSKTLMATLEASELMRLLHSAQNLRDRAVLTLIMDNGMRAGEVCSLLKHNIKQETVVVCGKTGWREVPISEETRRLLLQVAAKSPDERVFHGHKGPITRFGIYHIVREHMEKAGIRGPKLGPHRIRHAFGKNFLVAGPPALAKTLFLWDIERAAGERAIWLLGSTTSKAGLWDLVAERQPRILEIDELDKMNAADTAALLSIMESGRLVRAKRGRELELTHLIWVVAATNKLYGLSPELLSRFAVRKLAPYCPLEYQRVVKGVLVRRENASPELAQEIAQRLDGRSQDVRDAVRTARLAPQVGVNKAVRLLGLDWEG